MKETSCRDSAARKTILDAGDAGLVFARGRNRPGTVLFAALFALLSAAGALPFAVFAADDGAYLAATNTYYLNPDTGVTDDGGSRNAAIGEGMCRSVIYEKALVEIEDGNVYITVRVQLVSNMGAIKFTVQRKPGDPESYASVSPRAVAEDAGADTADYRFQVPDVSSYIGCSTYVTPMGRDVKFYMNLSSDLTAGSGDFVVSAKPKAAQTKPTAGNADATAGEVPAEIAAPAGTDTDRASETPAADPDGAGDAAQTETPAPDGGSAESGTPANEALPPDLDGATDAADESSSQTPETAGENAAGAAALPGSASAGDGAADETNARENATATENEDANVPNAAPVAVGLALVILLAIIYIIRKNKKKFK